MARTIKLDTITHPSNSGTANQTLDSSGQTSFPTVDINGGAIDNCTIGGTTAGAGTFSTVTTPSLKPSSGQSLQIKEDGGATAITVDTSGNTTVANNLSVNGNTTIGDSSSDTLTVTATASGSAMFAGLSGEIRMYGGISEPSGWKFCNAQALNTFTFKELHAVISNYFGGTAYNAGVTDQSGATTTFNVPDMRGRVPVGVNAETSLSNRGQKNLGENGAGGADTVTLTAAQSGLPAHNHSVSSAHTHGAGTLSVSGTIATVDGASHTDSTSTTQFHDFTTPNKVPEAFSSGADTTAPITATVSGSTASATPVSTTGTVTAANASSAHDNLQPYLPVNYIIKT